MILNLVKFVPKSESFKKKKNIDLVFTNVFDDLRHEYVVVHICTFLILTFQSNSVAFYHFCVRQFMQFSLFGRYFFYLFLGNWHPILPGSHLLERASNMARKMPIKIFLHELPLHRNSKIQDHQTRLSGHCFNICNILTATLAIKQITADSNSPSLHVRIFL